MDWTLTVALTLARQGYPCFPCARDKRPSCPHGFKDASRDPAALRALFTRHPGPLIGVCTGAVSGIDVLDLDPKHPQARDWWAANLIRMLGTRIQRTRSGGLDLFFQHASGLRCSVGRIARGVDVRADRGYVIWWPLIGLPVLLDIQPAPWPDDLLQRLQSKSPPREPPRSVVPDDRRIRRILERLEAAVEGERNSLTHWAACRFAEMLGPGLSCDEAHALIVAAAMRAGLGFREASATARSGLRGPP